MSEIVKISDLVKYYYVGENVVKAVDHTNLEIERGKFTAIVSSIPQPVLGGVSLLLYGFIAVNGLKVLIKNQIDFDDPKNVVVGASMLVLGLGGAAISIISGDLSITISGMSLAAIVGILLNLFIPAQKSEEEIEKLQKQKEEKKAAKEKNKQEKKAEKENKPKKEKMKV